MRLPIAGRARPPSADPLRLAGRVVAITGVGERVLAQSLLQSLTELGVSARIVELAADEESARAALAALPSSTASTVTIGVGGSFYALCQADFRIAVGDVASIADRAVMRSADLWLAEPRVEVVRALAPVLRGAAPAAAP